MECGGVAAGSPQPGRSANNPLGEGEAGRQEEGWHVTTCPEFTRINQKAVTPPGGVLGKPCCFPTQVLGRGGCIGQRGCQGVVPHC
jgi:hypothetical protein